MSEIIADAEADVTDLVGETTVEIDQDDEGQFGIINRMRKIGRFASY